MSIRKMYRMRKRDITLHSSCHCYHWLCRSRSDPTTLGCLEFTCLFLHSDANLIFIYICSFMVPSLPSVFPPPVLPLFAVLPEQASLKLKSSGSGWTLMGLWLKLSMRRLAKTGTKQVSVLLCGRGITVIAIG